MNLTDAQDSPSSRGRTMYLKFLRGERLTASQAIIAKCFECCGGYVDGRADCNVTSCPLYPMMPYRTSSKESPND